MKEGLPGRGARVQRSCGGELQLFEDVKKALRLREVEAERRVELEALGLQGSEGQEEALSFCLSTLWSQAWKEAPWLVALN